VVEDVEETEAAKDLLPVCDLRASAAPLKAETPIHLGRVHYVVVAQTEMLLCVSEQRF